MTDILDEVVVEEDEFAAEAERRMRFCDECGESVNARWYVATPDGGVLRYCGHHINIHKAALRELGAGIYDLSSEG